MSQDPKGDEEVTSSCVELQQRDALGGAGPGGGPGLTSFWGGALDLFMGNLGG